MEVLTNKYPEILFGQGRLKIMIKCKGLLTDKHRLIDIMMIRSEKCVVSDYFELKRIYLFGYCTVLHVNNLEKQIFQN